MICLIIRLKDCDICKYWQLINRFSLFNHDRINYSNIWICFFFWFLKTVDEID